MDELSYVDILIKLRNDVNSDIMSEKDKSEIISLISQLENKLWKYSN